ncbi:hypothetical protein AC579_8475 [Pseudocercospora musae]|uniref:Uncharacterized protein n=1 Tax=Pseudocercospora musae TaxID=113226 RepID=A0A139I1W8_9PEZI|nr:hypothetical protein AC579_8475 [Pseudocercospora musae]
MLVGRSPEHQQMISVNLAAAPIAWNFWLAASAEAIEEVDFDEDLTIKLHPLTHTSYHQIHTKVTPIVTIPPNMTENQAPPRPREDQKIFPFLNLPAELRNQIYDNVIDNNGNNGVSPQSLTLLASNQQIRAEFGSMLWYDANIRNDDRVIPGQLPLKPRTIPGHVVRQLNCFQMLLKLDARSVGNGRDKTRIWFSCNPREGSYRLWGVIRAKRSPSWLVDEIEKYHAWRTVRSVEAWMADKLPGLKMHPETAVPGATIYPGQYPYMSTSHTRNGLPIIAYHFGPPRLPLRQKLLVFFHAEGHILLLKEQAFWKSLRVEIGDRKVDVLQEVAVNTGVAALLWLFSLIPGMKSMPFVPLVAVPAMGRLAIDDLPWATQSWILMRLQWVWPMLFVSFTAILTFSHAVWSWWYIPALMISCILAIS